MLEKAAIEYLKKKGYYVAKKETVNKGFYETRNKLTELTDSIIYNVTKSKDAVKYSYTGYELILRNAAESKGLIEYYYRRVSKEL